MSVDVELNRWIARPRPNPSAKVRLVCIPFAGGGSNIYRPWAPALPPDVELCLVQLPGREVRFSEPPLARAESIIDALVPALRPWADLPLALFGHSMGALLAFLLARRLESLPGFRVATLMVSGRGAPHRSREDRVHDLPEPELMQKIRRMNGTPPEVLAQTELMRLLLPILRADFAVDETATTLGDPLSCPILALGGRRDEMAPEDTVLAWRECTRGTGRASFCEGGHFFVQEDRAFVLGEVAAELRRLSLISA